VNTVEKYCTYCKKTGHKREDCWSLNGRPGKERTTRPKREIEKGKQVNAISKPKTSKSRHDSDDSSFSSSGDEENRPAKKITRAVREHQITQVIKPHANTGLDLVTLPIKETKKGKTSFLLDTAATLTLVKIGNLKGDTKMRDERIALTGVTGHKIYTLGKIRATIPLGEQKIRHTMYVVKDDFPIDYDGILGWNRLPHEATSQVRSWKEEATNR